MAGSDAASPIVEPDKPPEPSRPPDLDSDSDARSEPRASLRASFWLRELPYVVVLILTLFGVAYMSFAKQSIVGYWEFMAPVLGIVCVGNGWGHAQDQSARTRLIWTQVLHWLAFLVAMNLILLSGVQATFTANASGLMVLTLLALGTFTAGVHIVSWQICLLGVVMALAVPALAWIERSALFVIVILIVPVAIGLALWWNWRHAPAARSRP